MADPIRLPTAGYARGAVVRLAANGPNMLVVRSGVGRSGDRTAVAVVDSDAAGSLRLRDYATADLHLVLPAQTPP